MLWKWRIWNFIVEEKNFLSENNIVVNYIIITFIITFFYKSSMLIRINETVFTFVDVY